VLATSLNGRSRLIDDRHQRILPLVPLALSRWGRLSKIRTRRRLGRITRLG
jgi:hypothetical protein